MVATPHVSAQFDRAVTHNRFVLYDGGLGEREAEPIVLRADAWVEEIFHAA